MLDQGLRKKVDLLWDKFWAGGLANPFMAIDQMNFLIFLKRLEDIDQLSTQRAAAQNEKHSSIFEGAGAKARWSYWSHLEGQEMFSHVRDFVFPWLKKISVKQQNFETFMKDAMFLIPKPSLLVEAVTLIEDLAITDRNVDTQGDIYEYMLGKLNVAGQAGQFRTPRHIIRAMVQMVDPKPGEPVIDPACGTGGFLIAAAQHIIGSHTSPEFLSYDEGGAPHGLVGDKLSSKQWQWLKNDGLVGFDFDLSMVRIATMNMVLHGLDSPKVAYADSLGKQFSHKERAQVILANPPFAGSLDAEDVSPDFKTKTKKTELLFVQLFIDLLVSGGRAAAIVPDGFLFSMTKAHIAIRERLVEDIRLDGVVSLPPGTFKPYTNASCGILLFTKGGTTADVWMYDVTADGYSLDDKRLPIDDNDLPHLVQSWAKREITDRSFVVSVEQLRKNDYDLSVPSYQAVGDEMFNSSDPSDVLQEAEARHQEVAAFLATAKERLSGAKKATGKWKIEPLGDLVESESGEWGSEPSIEEFDVLVARSTDTRGDSVDLSTAALRSLSKKQFHKTALTQGDILVTKSSGSSHLVGKPAIVRDLIGAGAGFTNFMLRLRSLGEVEPEYLFAFLNSGPGRRTVERFQATTSGLRNLNVKKYLQTPIPVAPPGLRELIASLSLESSEAIALLRSEARAVSSLPESLLGWYFQSE